MQLAADELERLGITPLRIDEQRTFDGRPFPFVATPADEAEDLTAWAEKHRDDLLRAVREYDAVLLRGFAGAEHAEHFSSFVHGLRLDAFGMGCSAAPRTNVAPGVFTANEAPPSELIPFHHEMAQCDERPDHVLFFCETPAAAGGATPIIPSHAVASYLRERHPRVADKLARLGVRYARVLPSEPDLSSPIGKSWRDAYNAIDRAEAEATMAAEGTSWTWLPNGELRTVTKPMPALVADGHTGREMFFNSVVAATQGWADVRNDPRRAVLFGDGSTLDDAALGALADVSLRTSTCSASS